MYNPLNDHQGIHCRHLENTESWKRIGYQKCTLLEEGTYNSVRRDNTVRD